MNRTRVALAVLAISVATSPATAGIFQRKARLDAARVKNLVEVLRAEPDERKRKAAVVELRDADPRSHGDVIPALANSLLRDASPGVRVESADSLRQYKVVFPVAGLALETAAEGDTSPQVRDAAKQALWEYHLGGYRSAKGTDGFAGQTAEPPLARPASRMAGATASVIVRTAAVTPVEAVTVSQPKFAAPLVPTAKLPPPASGGIRTLVSAVPPPVLNLTPEPPLAPRGATAAVHLFTVVPISIPTGPNRFRGANPLVR